MTVSASSDDEVKKILAEHSVYIQDIYRKVDKLYKHLLWQRILSWFYFALIIVPIVASLFFLPAFIRGLTGLVDPTGSLQLDKIVVPKNSALMPASTSTNDLLKQYQDLLRQIQR